MGPRRSCVQLELGDKGFGLGRLKDVAKDKLTWRPSAELSVILNIVHPARWGLTPGFLNRGNREINSQQAGAMEHRYDSIDPL